MILAPNLRISPKPKAPLSTPSAAARTRSSSKSRRCCWLLLLQNTVNQQCAKRGNHDLPATNKTTDNLGTKLEDVTEAECTTLVGRSTCEELLEFAALLLAVAVAATNEAADDLRSELEDVPEAKGAALVILRSAREELDELAALLLAAAVAVVLSAAVACIRQECTHPLPMRPPMILAPNLKMSPRPKAPLSSSTARRKISTSRL